MAEKMDVTGSGEPQEKRGMSRRTVLAGAAWSVPVIAVATAAPAMAASPPVFISAFGGGCKYPGRSNRNRPYGYVFYLELTNTTLETVSVSFDSISLDGQPLVIDEVQLYPSGTVVTEVVLGPAGSGTSTQRVAVFATGATNSQNGQLVVGYSWSVDGVLVDSTTASTEFNDLPPYQGAACVAFPA